MRPVPALQPRRRARTLTLAAGVAVAGVSLLLQLLLLLLAPAAGAESATATATATPTPRPAPPSATATASPTATRPAPPSATATPGASATPGPGATATAGRTSGAATPATTRTPGPAPTARRPATLPDERYLIVNQHGGLFYDSDADLQENAAYARWLGASAIRVFATDGNTGKRWDGRRVGAQIVRWAPSLRANRLALVVALVNNHQPVPGEAPDSAGWMDGYYQLQLPFYWDRWRGPYLRFADDLITTVREGGASDVIAAWEVGNELHTPQSPDAFPDFLRAAVAEVRKVDAATPIWPGTMGGHHLQPWIVQAPVARWLYCEAPVDAYTLHAYDWLSGDVPGDMPIHWDLDAVVSEPCPSGRRLPVIVEELGTTRTLPGWYGPDDEEPRLNLEQHQLRYVLGYPAVRAVGVWSGVSPRAGDPNYADDKRGLSSYGPGGRGGGSCYGVPEGATAGPLPARCRLEQTLRGLPAPP